MDFGTLKRPAYDEQEDMGFHMKEVDFEMGSFSHGDPYREPDVCRGISIPPPDFGSSMMMPCSEMDFYEPDLALKGVGFKGMDFPASDFGLFLHEPQKPQKPTLAERFSCGNSPPLADHELIATTQRVRYDAHPADIGNAIIDWMQQRDGCSISKVNQRKFRVKADVFANHMMCTLKICIYKMQQEEMVYALEFCRYGGEACAFAQAYKQLSTHLSDRFPGKGIKVPERTQFSPPALPVDDAGDFPFESPLSNGMMMPMMVAPVQPLLDMANSSDSPHLQAESASALASLAEDQASAEALCSGVAFESFAKLLAVGGRLDVAYPVACLLLQLAQHKAAQDHFVDKGLLPMMAAVVHSQETVELVKKTMARALAHAVGQCASKLSAAALPHFDILLALDKAAGLLDEAAVNSWDFARRTLQVR